MFEDLGYKETQLTEDDVYFEKQEKGYELLTYHFIGFALNKQKINIYAQDITPCVCGSYNLITKILTIEELQAINEFCKERGWKV